MKHEDSKIFIRGQVWYWEDPVYGDKSNQQNTEIPQGEQAMRFNRYVIIVQNTDSIRNNSVLVIPCTTKDYKYNVKVSISHLTKSNVTNANVESIISVHQKQLKRYICTLSEVSMKRIDKVLRSWLFESQSDDEEDNVVYDNNCGNDYDNSNECEKCIESNDAIEDDEDNIESVILPESGSVDINSMMKNHDNDIIYPPVERLKKWNDYSIEIFSKMFKRMGDKYTAEYFGIKLNSAQKYMIQWRKRAWYHMKDDFYVMKMSFENIPDIVNEITSLIASSIGLSSSDFDELTDNVINKIIINEIIGDKYPSGKDKFIEIHKMIYVLNEDLKGNNKLRKLVDDKNVYDFMKEYRKIYPNGGIDIKFIQRIVNAFEFDKDNDIVQINNIEHSLLTTFKPIG